MDQSYIKTGSEVIEYWMRILSVVLKDRLFLIHLQTFHGIRGEVKNKDLVSNELDPYQLL